MYEDGITVTYRLSLTNDGPTWWSDPRTLDLPGWAAGDPQMVVALYLFGDRSYADDVKVVGWTDGPPASEDNVATLVSTGSYGTVGYWENAQSVTSDPPAEPGSRL